MSNVNFYWEKIPAQIVSLKKGKGPLGILRIEATLKSRLDPEKEFKVNWVYGPSVQTSNKIYGNFLPEHFEWAYDNAKEGMDVVLHHCTDDNSMYFYES